MGYSCDNDDGNAAIILVTDLSGETEALALCGPCLPTWIEVMNNELNVTPARVDAVPTDPITGDDTDEDEHADGQLEDHDDAAAEQRRSAKAEIEAAANASAAAATFEKLADKPKARVSRAKASAAGL